MSRPRAAAILEEAGMPPDPPPALRDLPDFDLGELAAAGIKPPEMVAGGMLYRGGVHCLAGQPGGGKSTVMAWWLLEHIRDGGHVLLLDEESGPELIAEKFLDLGADPAELRPPRFSYVPFPCRGWNLADVAQLHARIAGRRPGIVAWDSAAAFLTIAGRDENSAADVTAFWQRVLMPCAREFHAAVVAVDHTGKGDHLGYSRGSGAKKAASDVQYILETIKPFSRHQDGLLSLTTSPGKDRRGHLAVRYEIRVTTGALLALHVSEAAGPASTGQPGRMPPAKAKLLEALRAMGGRPVPAGDLVDWIAATHGHGLKRQTVSTHLNELLAERLADVIDQGGRSPKLWFAAEHAAVPAPPASPADPRPPCSHAECWDALAGACLVPGWPAGSDGEAENR
jgi:hypothetical protein